MSWIWQWLRVQVLKWEDVEVEDPKEGEIRVKNKAIGVNFIDVYYRQGVYSTSLPFTPGKHYIVALVFPLKE